MLWAIGVSVLGFLFFNRESIVKTVEEKMDSWTQYDNLYKKYGLRWGVDWTWLKAIAINESRNGQEKSVRNGIEKPSDTQNSKSSDGKSWGIMQVTLVTARDMDLSATPEKLNNIEYSINLGARYVAKMKDYFSESDPRYIEWVIKSYNQGPGNTSKEKSGKIIKGYADEYWVRWQSNLKRVRGV